MSDSYKIEKNKKDIIEAFKLEGSNLSREILSRSGRTIPSIQINNDEFHSFGGRRSSIPASLSNFNIHVYNRRRYSEVILSPTDSFRQDYFKFSTSPLTKINDCLSDVFGNLSKRLSRKTKVVQVQASSLEPSKVEAWEVMDEVKCYKNPLEDSYEGNEKIVINSNEFLEEEETLEDVHKATVEVRPQDTIFVTNESGKNSRRNSDERPNTRGSYRGEELVLKASSFGSPAAGGERRDSDKAPVQRRTSSPLSLKNPRRRSEEINRPLTRGDFQRLPSHLSEGKGTPHDRYQDNLKTIVLSYFHLTHPKWEHANVNGTRHWDRRASRVTVHPVTNSIPRDAFGSRMSVITDEGLTNPSPFNETDKDSLLKCSELEYSSGGLLCIDNEEHPDSAPIRPPDSETLLFSDGKRRIDLVLVYEEQDEGVMGEADMLKKERRKVFKENLEKEGLEFELEDKKGSFDEKTFFLKIHAPWQVMTRYAELMNIKMPIRVSMTREGQHQHSQAYL